MLFKLKQEEKGMLIGLLIGISRCMAIEKSEEGQCEIDPTLEGNKNFNIAYLNLERAVDRKAHIEYLLTSANCEFQRFDAVDGDAIFKNKKKFQDYVVNLQLKEVQDPVDYSGIDGYKAGMIGCKMTHYLILRAIEAYSPETPLLVLEDDADLEHDFVSKIKSALKEVPDDWDMLLITEHYRQINQHRTWHLQNIAQAGHFYEGLGYLINGAKSAKKIADLIVSKCNPWLPIDDFYGHMAASEEIKVYALKRKLAIQRRDLFTSSIPSSAGMGRQWLSYSLTNYLAEKKRIKN